MPFRSIPDISTTFINCFNYKKIYECSGEDDRKFAKGMRVIKATFPDACVKVDRNCCAGVTVETHEAALKTMEMCQIEIV